MYESFFQLNECPFASAPRVDRYFAAASAEGSRQTLARCIERAEGAGMLVGPAGSGKTLVCHMLADQFRDRFAVALLANGHLSTRRSLLQAILFELGLPYRGLEEGELRLSLIDHLASDRAPQGMLLLLDEAHTFPIRLLEEVRLITNLVRGGQPRVRLVIAGNPLLEERFANPLLDSFSQRISSRCYLEGLDRAQTEQYIAAQIAAVGGTASRIFTPDALEAAYRATDGIPRLVNQVCDHALMLAYAGGQKQIDGAGIEEAWSDLQQLPSPWNESRARAEPMPPSGGGIVEFGGLDDDPQLEHNFETPQPTVLLHEIDEHLSALDEEFQPVATIGPMAVVEGRPLPDPFSEPFAEEEVVVDRYAALGADRFEGQPAVHSQEGRILSALLEPFVQSSDGPRLSLVGRREADEAELGTPLPIAITAISTADPLAHSFDTSSAIDVWQANSVGVAEPSRPGPTAAQPAVAVEPHVMVSRPARAPFEEKSPLGIGDDDQIVVEDDPRPEPARERTASAAARRQEYRQLFSTLRRG